MFRLRLSGRGLYSRDGHFSRRNFDLPDSSCTSESKIALCLKLVIVFGKRILFVHSYRAVEALAVIVVGQSLHPSVTGFYRESTSETFGCEQLVPIGLTIGLAVLQEEWTVAEQFAAMGTSEALRMEVFANGIQAIAL